MKTRTFIWKTLLHNKWTLAPQIVTGIIATVAIEHIGALTQREVFDSLTGDARTSMGIWALCAILAGLSLGYATIRLGSEMLWRYNRFTLTALLQRNAFDFIMETGGDRSLPASLGEAVSRFRNDTLLAISYTMNLVTLISGVLFFVIAMFIMVRISAATAFVVAIPLPAVAAIIYIARQRIRRYREAAREAAGGVTGLIGEMYGMVEAIKVSNAEGRVINQFDRLNEERGRTSLMDDVLAKTLNAISSNAHNVTTGIVLVLLARSMSQGVLTVGDLSLFVFYLEMTQMLGSEIGDLLTGYRRVGVSINRLHDLMPGAAAEALVEPTPSYLFGRLPVVPVPETVTEHQLEVLDVQGLTYSYPDSDVGVRDVSFTLKRGEFTVVTGRIGSGKTTLLQTLIGWLPPQSGTVRWNGVAIDQPGDFLVPPICGYMSQVPRLFSETLRANILMGLSEEHVDLPGAVRSAVLDHDVEELVAGLDTMVGPRGGETLRGSAATGGRGKNVRARPRTVGAGRSIERSGC
jgi:ATP-binding cassette, subfamily B, bacterial